ncbi:helix-turn-helix transcriptional regulator [Paradevosia shaoguanensis]|uniref:helix-turn-helix transcriptional regulator n=1 Tax=Paradevosia shaoguanensis TaxID=1335043 RepID=UPI003C7811CB
MDHDLLKPAAIGGRLIKLRTALGVPTSAAFAAMVEITPQALNNYERGRGRPNLDQALRIVAKTGVTLDWIYLGEISGLSVRLAQVLAAEGVGPASRE